VAAQHTHTITSCHIVDYDGVPPGGARPCTLCVGRRCQLAGSSSPACDRWGPCPHSGRTWARRTPAHDGADIIHFNFRMETSERTHQVPCCVGEDGGPGSVCDGSAEPRLGNGQRRNAGRQRYCRGEGSVTCFGGCSEEMTECLIYL
jgi:hypothetical protein